jgi:hypothetical protein
MAGIKPQSLRAVATSLSLPRDLERELTRRASRERVPRSTVAVRLLRRALEADRAGRGPSELKRHRQM